MEFLVRETLIFLYIVIDGVYNPKDGERKAISKDLNKFAGLLIEEYMVDVQKELDSKEVKCQKAALLLMASFV